MADLSVLFERNAFPKKENVFVLMPFKEPFNTIYHSTIVPAVESTGFQCVRADEIYSNRMIMGDVWQGIQQAQIVIAELTGKNPNVMYELGLSHALWRHTIYLTQDISDVPFDLRHMRILDYSTDRLEVLRAQISNTLKEVSGYPFVDPLWTTREMLLKEHALFGIDVSKTKYSWDNMVSLCSKELMIFGPTLSFWTNNEDVRASLIEQIKKRRTVIAILSTWEPIVAFGGTGPEDLRKSIVQFIKLKESLPEAYKKYLKVRFHFSVSTLSGVMCDSSEEYGRLSLTIRLADQHNSDARFFVGLDKKLQPSLFDTTSRAFFNLRFLGEDFEMEEMLSIGENKGYVKSRKQI